jgi:hypothetical protein
MREFHGADHFFAVAFSPDGSMLAASKGNRIEIFRAPTARCCGRWSHVQRARLVAERQVRVRERRQDGKRSGAWSTARRC